MKKILSSSAIAVLGLTMLLAFTHPAAGATITVTNGNDSGAGSLRDAIALAGKGDTIVFDGDYTITLDSQLVITQNLTIDGSGHEVILSGNDTGRVAQVGSAVHVTFDRLTIAHGNGDQYGGGIYIDSGGVVTLTRSTLFSNTAIQSGGGVRCSTRGTLTVQDTTFLSNTAGDGAGIFTYSPLMVLDSTFTGNRARSDGGGISQVSATLTVQGGTFTGNSAVDTGGGISSSGRATVQDSTFTDNSADTGGAIHNQGGTMRLTHDTFLKNMAGEGYNEGGGGIMNKQGTLTVTHCIVAENSEDDGDGGAGIHNYEGTLMVDNCAIYGNTTTGSGGGIKNEGPSGATTATVRSSTVYSNAADDYGGGLYNDADQNTTTLVNSVLWANSAISGGAQISNTATVTPRISYCDIEGSGGSTGWDTALGRDDGGNIDADPLFVGASAPDFRLQVSSPAIDAGNNLSVTATIDLAEAPRRMDVPTVPDYGEGASPIVDMGAYETGPYLSLDKLVSPGGPIPYRSSVVYTLLLENRGLVSDSVQLSDTIPSGLTFDSWITQPSGMVRVGDVITWTGTVRAGQTITGAFSAAQTADAGKTVTNTAAFSGTYQSGNVTAAFTAGEGTTPAPVGGVTRPFTLAPGRTALWALVIVLGAASAAVANVGWKRAGKD